MTIKRWIAPLFSLVLICSLGQVSFAQGGYPPAGGAYQQTMPADVFGQQGYNPASNSSVATGPFQTWMKPWPAISPFENKYSELFWKNGIWNRIQIPAGGRGRRYHGHLGIAKARFRQASPVRVGAVGVRDLSTTLQNPTPPNFQIFNMSVLNDENPNVGGVNPLFVQEHHKNKRSPGVEMTYGFNDVDGGGGDVSFYWLTGTDQLWERGADNNNGFRAALGAVAILDETGGYTIPFDNLLRVQLKSQAAGIQLNLLNRPLFKGKTYRVRSSMGMRYTYLNEAFKFEGRFSGDDATFNDDGSLVAITTPNAFPAVRAEIESIVTTHLLGPQVGLDYEVGGKSFKLAGFSKIGIMLAAERASLEESGLFAPIVHDNTGASIANPNPNPARNSTSKKNSAHLSPMFEQEIHADMNVIKLIPVLKSMKMFDDAKLRVGYKFTGIWEVSRPYETIMWAGGQLNPGIDGDKRGFMFYDQFSASISWER